MSTRKCEYRLHRRVQFYEADPAGIVHFSWFFRYMEEAEHALWRDAGMTIAGVGNEIAFPRVSASFEYHLPLRFGEEFDVHIWIEAIAQKTIRYACVVSRDGTRIATGALTIVCVSSKAGEAMKAIPIPSAIASRFEVRSAAEAR